ncbi:MAG: hypothetical protein [Caudoviricetes sp.]|nr:MAG: hypothetical protein [Caudoviricetes sp.]
MDTKHKCKCCGDEYSSRHLHSIYCDTCMLTQLGKLKVEKPQEDFRGDIKLMAREIFIQSVSKELYRTDPTLIQHIANSSLHAAKLYFEVEDSVQANRC